ncbi:MAG: lipocalin-like domain-containing protein [Burkholderiales bacterium]
MSEIRSRLFGAWQLARWTITYDDGRAPTLPFGEAVVGLLIYSNDGHMSGSIARAGRKPLSSESARTAPAEEKITAFETFFSYAGTYHVEGDEVIHHVTMALYPNLVGTVQRRQMRFSDQGLELSAADLLPGSAVKRTHRLQWCR